jgi:hypothetical protein
MTLLITNLQVSQYSFQCGLATLLPQRPTAAVLRRSQALERLGPGSWRRRLEIAGHWWRRHSGTGLNGNLVCSGVFRK